MILKTNFRQTLSLLAILLVLAAIPQDHYASAILIGGVSAAVVLFLSAVGYYFYGRKKGLFVLILLSALMTAPMAQAGWFFSHAESNEIAEQYKQRILDLSRPVCDAKGYFDEDNLDVEPDGETMEKAYELLDKYNTLGMSDIGATSAAVDTVFSTLTFGLTKGTFNKYREAANCAEDYLSATASWQQKKLESMATTVPNILRLDANKCWPCGLANTMLEAIEKIIFNIEDYLKQAALLLLGGMTLFWIAFRTLIFFGHLGTASNAEYFSDILRRLILVVIAAAFLHAPLTSIYRLTLSPLIEVGIEMTNNISAINTGSMGNISEKIDRDGMLACACCYDENSNCNEAGEISELERPDVMLLEPKTRSGLLCMTCLVYKQTSPMIASGQGFMIYSFKNKHWYSELVSWATDGKTDLIPVPFGMFIFGILVVGLFTFLGFLVAFKLMDLFLQLGFVVILTPFLIATFPFPATRQYTKKGWEFLVAAVLTIIGLSLGTSLMMMVIMGVLPEYTQTYLADAIAAPESSKYFENLFDVFTGGPSGSGFFVAALLIISVLFGSLLIEAGTAVVLGVSGMAAGVPGVVFETAKGTAKLGYKGAKAGARLANAGKNKIKGKFKENEEENSGNDDNGDNGDNDNNDNNDDNDNDDNNDNNDNNDTE